MLRSRNPIWAPRPCDNCSRTFAPKKFARARFCSVRCSRRWHGNHRRAVDRKVYSRSCPECGVEFTVLGRQAGYRKYCGVKCRTAVNCRRYMSAMRKHDPDRFARWQAKHEAIMERWRDNCTKERRCIHCGKPLAEGNPNKTCGKLCRVRYGG